MNERRDTSAHGISFNKPYIVGKELDYIACAVANGQLAGNGEFTAKCQSWMEEKFSAKHVFLTHSGTAALEMGAILAGIEPGDEVIMPSFTFVSTANAFVLRGARIVFVDIREDTLNIDERQLAGAITERTRAIVPVHYAGVACEMDAINALASEHELVVIEDAAHGVNATYRGAYLGTIGDLGAYSFHETKNFISGEGGALVVNQEALMERTHIIREKGTDRTKFLSGQIDKYSWVDIGSSYLPSEITAAFLFAQLEEADRITDKRMRIFDKYYQLLQELAQEGCVSLPVVPDGASHNAHMFYIIVRSGTERGALISHLADRGIEAVFHYVPLHSSAMGQRCGMASGSLDVTESVSVRLVRLPCYYELTEPDQERVVDEIYGFFGRARPE